MDFVSYKNQLKACRMTGGIVPHPAVTLLKSPTGMPMTTPFIVCLVGKPASSLFPMAAPAPAPVITSRASAPAIASPASCPAYVPSSNSGYSGQDSDEWLREATDWIVERVWPLSKCEALGNFLFYDSQIIALVSAFVGALVFLGIANISRQAHALLSGLPEGYAPWVASGCGAVVGGIAPKVLGWLLIAVVRLVALGIILTGIAAIAGIAYAGICLLEGHHPF